MPSLFETGTGERSQFPEARLISGLRPRAPEGGKHECVLLGRPALSTPFVIARRTASGSQPSGNWCARSGSCVLIFFG